ncbi:unnamed protein product [Chrysoparadoxa australica]
MGSSLLLLLTARHLPGKKAIQSSLLLLLLHLLVHTGASLRLLVAGGGAAGIFAAIEAASGTPGDVEVVVLEQAKQPLGKVRISGGGRCNVMHNPAVPVSDIVLSYPRGSAQLRGPMTARFGPADAEAWFTDRGVELKVEPDGRVFPVTDSSSTIIDCLLQSAAAAGVKLIKDAKVAGVTYSAIDSTFAVEAQFKTGNEISPAGGASSISCDKVLLACGSSREGLRWAEAMGHTIEQPIPSLFTLKVQDSRLEGLEGVSVQLVEIGLKPDPNAKTKGNFLLWLTVRAKGKGKGAGMLFTQRGPMLITHSGVSGPAALKLSAWGARYLFDAGYKGVVVVNWLGGGKKASRNAVLEDLKSLAKKAAGTYCPLQVSQAMCGSDLMCRSQYEGEQLPRRLWRALLGEKLATSRWSEIGNGRLGELADQLTRCELTVTGKGQFKDEFVTCGGVSLSEVEMDSGESKIVPGLYFAGEMLSIDGVTGGFNFQSAWTTGYSAGHHIRNIGAK